MSIYGIVVFISVDEINSSAVFIAVIYKSKEKE